MAEEDEYCAWWQKNKKKVPHGHHKFLHKHEGTLAAHVGASVHHQKEADATSKAVVKDYSINKAKKDNLLPGQSGHSHNLPKTTEKNSSSTPPAVTFTEEEVTGEEAKALVAEEAQMNPGGVSAVTTTAGQVVETVSAVEAVSTEPGDTTEPTKE